MRAVYWHKYFTSNFYQKKDLVQPISELSEETHTFMALICKTTMYLQATIAKFMLDKH